MATLAQGTIFEALLTSLWAASQYDRNDQAAPVVVLWTDMDSQWRPLLPCPHQQPTIQWGIDRGTNPEGSKRGNDVHLTAGEKQNLRLRPDGRNETG